MITPETYKIGISLINGISASLVRKLDEEGIGPEEFFTLSLSEISTAIGNDYVRDGIRGGLRIKSINRDEILDRALQEHKFISQHGIRIHYLTDESYPRLLAETEDAPVLLYQLGKTDLNRPHLISIVGTRKPTVNASCFCDKFLEEMGGYVPDLTVISGLAYGVDSMAHTGALSHGLTTIAVMAHGLNIMYPAAHRDLAKRIIESGGSLLSEYPSGTSPYKRRFLERNRIVAGLSEITMVIESPIKGGAMNTANTAFSYSREVVAVPGRVNDEKSAGCNHLIRKEKAHLIERASDVMELMNWLPEGLPHSVRQRNLFPELTGESGTVYSVLKNRTLPSSADDIHQTTGLQIGTVISVLTELEFDGLIVRLPGNRYIIS